MRREPSHKTLAILAFHKIGDPSPGGWKTWFYVPEETFVGHLTYLRENGWQVIDVSAFLTGLEAPDSLPERSALITFDDGYRSIPRIALPWLLRFGYPAVAFVPTDYIGCRNQFDDGIEPEEAICDWDDLQELNRGGVSIQSHGASHRRFSELSLAEQQDELLLSKAALEDKLGSPVQVIAFPYGDPGANEEEGARALRDTGYHAACLYRKGKPIPLPVLNPYRLARVAMGPDTDLQAVLEQR